MYSLIDIQLVTRFLVFMVPKSASLSPCGIACDQKDMVSLSVHH